MQLLPPIMQDLLRTTLLDPASNRAVRELPLPRRFGPALRAAIPARAALPVMVVPSTPDAAARTSGIRTFRVRATLSQCASPCTRDPRFALGPVSSIHLACPGG